MKAKKKVNRLNRAPAKRPGTAFLASNESRQQLPLFVLIKTLIQSG